MLGEKNLLETCIVPTAPNRRPVPRQHFLGQEQATKSQIIDHHLHAGCLLSIHHCDGAMERKDSTTLALNPKEFKRGLHDAVKNYHNHFYES